METISLYVRIARTRHIVVDVAYFYMLIDCPLWNGSVFVLSTQEYV